jgi:hypothetical protein
VDVDEPNLRSWFATGEVRLLAQPYGWNNEILAGIRDFGMDFSDLIVLVVLLASLTPSG